MNHTMKQLAIAVMALSVVSVAALWLGASPAIGKPATEGADLFKAKCAMCHAADGSGGTPVGKSLKIPDLRSAEVQGQSDGQLATAISSGKGKMPAYGKSLSPEQIRQLVAYIRGLKKG